MIRIILMSLTLISCSFITSCGNTDTASTAHKPFKALADIVPGRVPVVEVRSKDLKKMASGADRALAWDRHLDSKRYASTSGYQWFKPTNYKAPRLPDSRSMPTNSGILPPRNPGLSSSLESRGSLPSN